MARRRAVLVSGIAMLATAAAAMLRPSRRKLAGDLPPLSLERDTPLQFAEWNLDTSLVPVLPAPDVARKLSDLYSQLVSRTYIDSGGRRVMLVMAYGANQDDSDTMMHLPEACYPGQGFEIGDRYGARLALPFGSLGIIRLVARKGPRVEPITYWTVLGERTFNSEVQRRLARAKLALSGVLPDGMLVRVSTIGSGIAEAYAIQDRFILDLSSALPTFLRPRVFGA
jgi:EpsI family protein